MVCSFCGHEVSPGESQCPRCGGAIEVSQLDQPAPDARQADQPPTTPEGLNPFVSSSAVPAAGGSAPPPTNTSSAPEEDIFTSAQDIDVNAPPVSTFGPADPEAELHTVFLKDKDRQESIDTRMVEAPPPAAAPALADRAGLPDSKVARGVEDAFLEIKRLLFRLGRVGRLAAYSHLLVVVGVVSPWLYMPHLGYTPGVETWGAIPLVMSLGALSLLVWRFRPKPTHLVLPMVLHLVLAAGIVVSLFWRYQLNLEIEAHIRPQLAFGFYLTGLGALSALLCALLGLKDLK